MLAIHFGTDTAAIREAAFKAVAATGVDAPDIISGEGYETGQLADTVGGASLFGSPRVVVIDTPTDDMATELTPLLETMAAGTDTFIIIEGALLAAAKKRYGTYTSNLYEYTAMKAERFNTFALADSLAARNKKQLWLLLQQALQAGVSSEEVIGVLWWQLKSLRLAALTANASEAGIKDYPYGKAKRALVLIPLADAERLSHQLLDLYHQGHSGETDITLALEQWMLTL